jgi:TRAP-type C4-dicarboxylate transport system substrate-binding protein
MFRKYLTMVAAAALVVGVAGAADAAVTLKIGTLAPQDSPWGKEFKKTAKQISDETNGELQLDFQWNGQAGDEVLMVQKIRSGQLDGAAVTAIGLAQTGVSDVLLFQLPGMFSNWAKLDQVRNAVKDDLGKQFEAKGFTILGWGDVGAAKNMTVGFQVHRPADLQGKGVFFITGDPVQPKIYSAIGGITPKSLSINEILPALTTGAINILTVPPLAAEQLQWASRVTDVNSQTVAFAIGAFLMSSPRLAAIPAKLKEVMLARGGEMSDRLTTTIRNADAAAWNRMKQSKKVYDTTDAERHEWAKVFTKVCKSLRGTVFSPAMFDKVVSLAQPPFEE